jgi:hypothetical protein
LIRNPTAWLALFAVATLVLAVTLYAPDSDAAFAVWDGAWYGHMAQWHTPLSILPHHPGFHALVAGLMAVLRSAGVADAGHVAARVVAGIGAALVLVLIARLSGPGRRGIGLLFALVLFGSRCFILETATGENLFPAFAAALLLLECATADQPDLRKVSLALVLALVLRQDNLLLLPGVLLALIPALPRPGLIRRLALMLASSGAIVIALYCGAWLWARNDPGVDEGLVKYLTRFAHTASTEGLEVGLRTALHFGSLGVAVIGRWWEAPLPHILAGAAWVAGVLVATLRLRGTSPSRRYANAVLVTIAIRVPFYTWFEPQNFEWWMLTMLLLLALGSRTARGEPATSPSSRWAGVALLVALAAIPFAIHAPNTWALRQRTFAPAVDAAIRAGGPNAYYLAVEKNAYLALEMRHKACDRHDTPYGADVDPIALEAMKQHVERKRPIVVLADRWVETGMPWDRDHAQDKLKSFDLVATRPPFTILRWQGRNYAAVIK